MGNINVIYDYSPLRPWLFANLWKNQELLENAGIKIAPANCWKGEVVPVHHHFWSAFKTPADDPAFLQADTRMLEAHLERGGDILLFAYTPSLTLYHNLCKRLERWRKHNVRFMFIVGNPVFAYENSCREWAGEIGDARMRGWAPMFKEIPQVIGASARLCPGSTSFLPVIAQSSTARPDGNALEQAFNWLGISKGWSEAAEPLHPLFFGSTAGRRLCFLHEVRWNSWPRMDSDAYGRALARADKEWGEQLVSPKECRKALAESGCIEKLEQAIDLKTGTLATPSWYLESPEMDGSRKISEQEAELFASMLDPETRRTLAERFSNDASILKEEQKTLAAALATPQTFQSLTIGESQPVLTVLTMAYNHEKYIADCMESVLAQKTDFPVRHIVLDHCSTDGTARIIEQYAAAHPAIQPVLLSSRKHPENVRGLFMRCRSEFAALCDGDDYFTDPLKLQKQVDFLQKNKDCSICFHPVRAVYEGESNKSFVYPDLKLLPRGPNRKYYLADLFKSNFIQTNSAVYRWRFRDGLPDWFQADLCPGDWYWHLLHAETGKIGMLPEVMAVYRRHPTSLYATSFASSSLEHRKLHGMGELKTYAAINAHFKNRYFQPLADLANGVLADYLKIMLQAGDSSLLDKAVEKYPDFGRNFLQQLKAASSQA